jgi:hypothetical protein
VDFKNKDIMEELEILYKELQERDFGRVGDIDKIEFLNITEDAAIKINKKISSDLKMGIYPKWYYSS